MHEREQEIEKTGSALTTVGLVFQRLRGLIPPRNYLLDPNWELARIEDARLRGVGPRPRMVAR
jgi:hypothetical protein